MTRCEHCGSPLPDGAIFCGECGRAVNTASARREQAPPPRTAPEPPPLQQPGASHGHRDPASDAWLPESTLDPATRAWLLAQDRSEAGPVRIETPDPYAPRSAPSHVHGSGSGLDGWTPAAAEEPSLDPAAFTAPASGGSEPTVDPAPDDEPAARQPTIDASFPDVCAPAPAPTWSVAPAPPAPAPAPAPQAPSWWIDRSATGGATPDTSEAGASEVGANGPSASDLAAEAPGASESAPGPSSQDAPTAGASTTGASTADEADVVGAAEDADRGAEPATGAEPTDVAAPTAAAEPASAADPVEPSVHRIAPTAAPGDTAIVEPLVDRQPVWPSAGRAPLVEPGSGPATCHVCGHTLEPDDIFCEECGVVRPAVTAAFTGPVIPLPIERPDWAMTDADEIPGGDARATRPKAEADAAAEPAARGDGVLGAEPTADAGPTAGAEQRDHEPQEQHEPTPDDAALQAPPTDDGPAEESAAAVEPAALVTPTWSEPVDDTTAPPSGSPSYDSAPSTPFAAPLPPIPPMPVSEPDLRDAPAFPPTSADEDDDEDVEATRIVGSSPTRRPVVLHVSTGERLTMQQSGLLGRFPRPEPGERFEQILTIADPGKSVSKTHLELGRDGDELWVSDRFSGNGTVIRHIDGSIRRCEPGRRYRVERGARVDIGEQFFLVQ